MTHKPSAILLLISILSLAPSALAQTGAVYAMTNAADANEIAVYRRFDDGTLSSPRYVSTGGRGTGGQLTTAIDPLASQGALTLSADARWLFAVNAGSDELTVFRVKPNRLERTDVVPTRGRFPVSVTHAGDLVYVLNAGGNGGIAGFRLDDEGTLEPLGGSDRSLALGGSNPPRLADSPAQIAFTPAADQLIVVLKGTDELLSFPLDGAGAATFEPVRNASSGPIPFGFAFDRDGRLVVSEILGGSDGRGSVSVYETSPGGALLALDPSVSVFQSATCWVAVAGRFIFVTNTSSGTLSRLRQRADGTLSLRGRNGTPAGTAGRNTFPIDLAVTPDGRFLYTLNAGNGTVGMHRVRNSGLGFLGERGGLPANDGAQGIAAR